MFGIMIKKNILGLLFLLSTLCLFNSCEDDPYYDDRYDLTSALCSGTWAETYPTTEKTVIMYWVFIQTGRDLTITSFTEETSLFEKQRKYFDGTGMTTIIITPTPSIWISQMEPTHILRTYRSEASNYEAYWMILMSHSQWNNKKGNRNDCLFCCSSAENRTRI